MPKMSFNTINADDASGKKLGSRHEDQLQKIFSSSPIISKSKIKVSDYPDLELTKEGLKAWFFDNVVNGMIPKSESYYGFQKSANVDFADAPDISQVVVGGGGLPSTPYVPNPASPGAAANGDAVNVDYNSIPSSDSFAALMNSKAPSSFGSGASANDTSRNPSVSSANMKTGPSDTSKDLGKSPASIKP